jgi:hypothetical protein
VQLRLEGTRIYVVAFHIPAGGAEDAHAAIVRSLDQGQTWQGLADPCGEGPDGEHDAYSLAAAPGGFVAVLCDLRAGPDGASMVVSDDGGTDWTSARLP